MENGKYGFFRQKSKKNPLPCKVPIFHIWVYGKRRITWQQEQRLYGNRRIADRLLSVFHIFYMENGPRIESLVVKPGSVNTKISKKALPGGTDTDGAKIFVGRASLNEIWMPCKIIPERNVAFVCKFKQFNEFFEFKILTVFFLRLQRR